MTRVAVALGSNLGDREANLDFGIAALSGLVSNLTQSSRYDTEPVGVTGNQPRYLNAVVVGDTALGARELLTQLLAIERKGGRTRHTPMASRTLDLDLILFGESRIEEPGLVVPHPRFRERLFVLEPLAEVAPGWIDPATGGSVSELLSALLRRRARSGPS